MNRSNKSLFTKRENTNIVPFRYCILEGSKTVASTTTTTTTTTTKDNKNRFIYKMKNII